jgi:5-methylcytosine-specific restriction endonuclease McrA
MRSPRPEFSKKVKLQAWERCGGCCEDIACNGAKIIDGAHYDHIIPAALGGEGTLENCQVLCAWHHRRKTKVEDMPRISKAKRILEKRAGLRAKKYRWPKRRVSA